MPKLNKRRNAKSDVPTYQRHNSGGRDRAFCSVIEDGRSRRIYLGKWNSPESKRKFRALIRCYLSGDRPKNQAPGIGPDDGVTIEDLVARFLVWGETHYVKHGKRTKSWQGMKEAAAPLLDLFRDELVLNFGPKKLQMVQAQMVDLGLARKTVNSRIRKLRRIFRWGVAEEIVSPWVWEGLRAMEPLQRGRTKAPECAPVEPVPIKDIQAVLSHMVPSLRAMVQVQLLTGMRPGELVQLRLTDIDRSGPDGCWVFTPRTHKNEHKSLSRRVVLSRTVQKLIKPFLTLDPEALIFNPSAVVEERKRAMRARRRSKVTPSQLARDKERRERPKRQFSPEWSAGNYRKAIHYACDAAGIERWSPGRLRHNFQDLAERACGLEASSKALGHKQLATTEHYRNQLDLDQAVLAMKAVESSLPITGS